MNNIPKLPDFENMPNMVGVLVKKEGGLPNPDHVSYYALESDRKLYIDTEIDENVLPIQRMILRWNMEDAGLPECQRKPVRLFIHSPGGNTSYMWSLIDTIEASVTPVETVNVGMAASAAGLIFLAGRRRLMMPRAKLLIHEGSARMAGDSTKVLDASDSYRKDIRQMREFILDRTGIPAATLSRQKNHDWELDSETCMKLGACDQIIHTLEEVI